MKRRLKNGHVPLLEHSPETSVYAYSKGDDVDDKPYTDHELRTELETLVRQYPTLRACGKAIGVDFTYISRVLAKEKPIGKRLAHILGYKPIQVYERLEQESTDE